MPDVRSLAVHSPYRCQHAGACCSSNWPIPVEADRLVVLQSALANGRLRPAQGSADAALEHPPPAPAETPALLGRHGASCAFFADAAEAGGGRCRVHTALGHDALPLACRQFPRVSVHDPRGVSITLSHYCPTAAGLLDADPPAAAAIVVNSPAFPAGGEYVGLDARTTLPPLLRPDMLMDWESWWACERLAVARLAGAGTTSADTSLARLRAAVIDLTAWSPADGPLEARVRDAFARADAGALRADPPRPARLIDAVFRAIPADVRPAGVTGHDRTAERARRHFLAAHAFASWMPHLGRGLETWLRSIETAAALLDAGAGVRQADLLLRHLVDPATLAAELR